MAVKWKGKSRRKCCSCVKFMKLIFLLSGSLLLTSSITGFSHGNPTLRKQIRSVYRLLRPGEGFSRQRSKYLHEECRNTSTSFHDALNKTVIAYASISKHEDRYVSEIQQLLDGKFGTSLRRRLHKPKYLRYRARFRRALKVVAINMRMTYEPTVLLEMLEKVKEPMDKHYKGLNYSNLLPGERYTTCAVVGNSGELLNTTRGSFIDSHEMVIRINNAKPKGLETNSKDFIGSKTTLMFMNSHILHQCSRNTKCFCHPYGSEVPIMLYLCDMEHMLDVAYCGGEHRSPIFLTDRRFDLLVARIARWYSIRRLSGGVQALSQGNLRRLLRKWEFRHRNDFHYSSGLQAVILALGLCNSVDLFGFGKNPRFRHHFHSSQLVEHYGHDFEAEYLFYHDLEKKLLDRNPFLCETGSYIPPVRIFH